MIDSTFINGEFPTTGGLVLPTAALDEPGTDRREVPIVFADNLAGLEPTLKSITTKLGAHSTAKTVANSLRDNVIGGG